MAGLADVTFDDLTLVQGGSSCVRQHQTQSIGNGKLCCWSGICSERHLQTKYDMQNATLEQIVLFLSIKQMEVCTISLSSSLHEIWSTAL